jgi:hypothetical protein
VDPPHSSLTSLAHKRKKERNLPSPPTSLEPHLLPALEEDLERFLPQKVHITFLIFYKKIVFSLSSKIR